VGAAAAGGRRRCADDAELRAARHPVQEHTRRVLAAAVAELPERCELRLDFEPPPRRVAIQQAAHVAGLAFLAPSMLSVHPVYGPWIALRALVVVEAVAGPPGPAPVLAPPCDCERACGPYLRRALALSARATEGTGEGRIGQGEIAEQWRAWVAVRDACPVGRGHRYSDAQIAYHYTKQRRWLDD
jgi:methylmalonic aciduria homocystinuria type C protein